MLFYLLKISEEVLTFAAKYFSQMFFKTHSRINPETGQLSIYYQLVENNRTALGGISQRSIMGVGFMDVSNSLGNRDVRKLGAEWLCLQTVRQLGRDRYSGDRGWSDHDRDLALAHLVCQTACPASELNSKTILYHKTRVLLVSHKEK